MGMNTTSTTVSNPSANIDAASVAGLLESLLNTQPRVTTADLASSAGISAAKVKSLLNAHYGDQVQFKRGRTGGIVLTNAIAKVDVEPISDDDGDYRESYDFNDDSVEEVID